jgi:hypothetical protein
MSFLDDVTRKVKQKAVDWDVQGKAEKLAAEVDRVAHEAKDKAAEYADDNRGKIREGLDKAGAKIDERTEGRYSDRLAKAKDTVSGGVDRLAEQRPGGATPRTTPPPGSGYAPGAAAGTSASSAQPYAPEPYTPDPIDLPAPIDEPPSPGTGWPQDAPRNP